VGWIQPKASAGWRGPVAKSARSAQVWRGRPRLTNGQGVPGKVARAPWGGGNMPDKVVVVGAHPSSGSMVRGKKGGSSLMFQGGGGVRWPGRAVMRSCSWRR
jgi:hypothetical protein